MNAFAIVADDAAATLPGGARDIGGLGTLAAAWMVEAACIAIGLLLAISAGLESGSLWLGIAAAAPFLAAAVVEAARIPLVKAFFTVRGVVWKAIAVVMILLAAVLTMENLVFGFERAFSVRIEEVRRQGQAASDAAARVADLEYHARAIAERRAALERQTAGLAAEEAAARARAEADVSAAASAGTQARDDARAQLEATRGEQTAMQERQRREQATTAATCRAAPERCAIGALNRRHQQESTALAEQITTLGQILMNRGAAADQERHAAVERRASALRDIGQRRQPLEVELHTLIAESAALDASLVAARRDATHAQADVEALRRQSQMHRLAQFLLGSQDDAAAMNVLAWFSFLSAAVLATAGSVLAALHYRAMTQRASDRAAPNRLLRAVRGWIARQRRKQSVVRIVEVEKLVEVPVDRIVEMERRVEVPVERVVEVEKRVEVVKPELVLVPVPLEATEEERRRIMARAAGTQPVRLAA